ncbi:unnamed protein product [Heligmosomoides polygyrus]|uniref:RPAP3_C domain-containing protein n=1 Tax=Heligmosomoides polygyrus TaxID=6339 RepID=A0A183G979_HELPZ|nr:unnamed protein product [Heligmosomoides polygyrus]
MEVTDWDDMPDAHFGRKLKSIAKSLSKLPEPSDYIVQRLMITFEQLSSMVIGLAAVVRILESEGQKLPEATTFVYDNLTQLRRVPLLEVTDWDDMPDAHFGLSKNVDFNKELEKWIRSGRARQTDDMLCA